jgi:AraC family transcriptional regulator
MVIAPRDLPQYVPGKVLLASDELDWQGVSVCGYGYRAQDVEVPALNEYVVVSYQRGATPMERRFDGPWTRTRCEPGDVSFLTRAQPSHWHWTHDIDVTHVYLSDGFVSNIATELFDRALPEVRLLDTLRAQDPVVTTTVNAIAREAQTRSLGGRLYVDALGTQLVVQLLRKYAAVTFRESADPGRLTPTQLTRVKDYIAANIGNPLDLKSLAKATQLGTWNFSRRFRASVGQSPHAYVIDQRIEQARRLLASTALPLKQVAAACGFSDQAHMTRLFQLRLQKTPASFKHVA